MIDEHWCAHPSQENDFQGANQYYVMSAWFFQKGEARLSYPQPNSKSPKDISLELLF